MKRPTLAQYIRLLVNGGILEITRNRGVLFFKVAQEHLAELIGIMTTFWGLEPVPSDPDHNGFISFRDPFTHNQLTEEDARTAVLTEAITDEVLSQLMEEKPETKITVCLWSTITAINKPTVPVAATQPAVPLTVADVMAAIAPVANKAPAAAMEELEAVANRMEKSPLEVRIVHARCTDTTLVIHVGSLMREAIKTVFELQYQCAVTQDSQGLMHITPQGVPGVPLIAFLTALNELDYCMSVEPTDKPDVCVITNPLPCLKTLLGIVFHTNYTPGSFVEGHRERFYVDVSH